jgi:hypothetical protein
MLLRIHGLEDGPVETTLVDLVLANADTMGQPEIDAIEALAVGERCAMCGGAAGDVEIERVA